MLACRVVGCYCVRLCIVVCVVKWCVDVLSLLALLHVCCLCCCCVIIVVLGVVGCVLLSLFVVAVINWLLLLFGVVLGCWC